MIGKIRIVADPIGSVEVELLNKNPRTLEAILKALPIESRAMRWGDEVYFETPVDVGLENPQDVVEVGDVAYWPPGRSICIFFGPTPASRSPNEIRPASPVNVFGKVIGDPRVFSRVKDGDRIKVERA